MKKPSLEEVRNHFRNAETIECIGNGLMYNLSRFQNLYLGKNCFEDGSYYFSKEKDPKNNSDYVLCWSESKGYAKILTYKEPKEETFVISREQISRLYDMADIQKMTLFKDEIKLLFPSAFEPEKKELVVGVWYINKYTVETNFTIINCQLFRENEKSGYGLHMGIWGNWGLLNYEDFREATQQEVEEALKAEAVRRGYKKGIIVIDLYPHHNNRETISSDDFDWETFINEHDYGLRDSDGVVIFFKGKWATIIQPKKMTQAEIEKELGYNIEIVK